MKRLTLTTALLAGLVPPVFATEASDPTPLSVVASHSGPAQTLAERIHADLVAQVGNDE